MRRSRSAEAERRGAGGASRCFWLLPPASQSNFYSQGGLFVVPNKAKKEISVQNLVLLGLMVALNVVLGRLSIQIAPEVRVSVFGFLPIALAASAMGPVYGALTGAAETC